MVRFNLNRQWTFILALGASLVCCSIVSRDVIAQAGAPIMNDPGDPGFTPPSAGDPDVPGGPGAKGTKSGKLTRNGSHFGDRTVGDGSIPRSAWYWRLRVVWMSLRGFYFRF